MTVTSETVGLSWKDMKKKNPLEQEKIWQLPSRRDFYCKFFSHESSVVMEQEGDNDEEYFRIVELKRQMKRPRGQL